MNEELEKRFEVQIREHERLIHKVCRMYAYTQSDHEDLFQDIVLQLWQAYPKFRSESKFSTWLYRVAINTAISGRRKQKDFMTTTDPADLLFDQRIEEAVLSEKEDRLGQLYNAIRQLNEIEKAIVMLYMEERTYAEMEEVMGISEATLRVKMNRIREKLRQLTKTN